MLLKAIGNIKSVVNPLMSHYLNSLHVNSRECLQSERWSVTTVEVFFKWDCQTSNITLTMANSTSNPPAENTRTSANTHVVSTADNSKGYPPFNIHLVPAYTNNQLCYYHTSEALLDIDKTRFRNQMKECKNILELVDWNDNTWESIPNNSNSFPMFMPSVSHMLSFYYDSEANSVCPEPISGQRGIKFNPTDIIWLWYDSNVA